METKTNKAIHLFQAGDYKAAFRLFSGFKMGFSDGTRRNIQIAYECIGNPGRCSFYKSIGVDHKQAEKDAILEIKRKYNI